MKLPGNVGLFSNSPHMLNPLSTGINTISKRNDTTCTGIFPYAHAIPDYSSGTQAYAYPTQACKPGSCMAIQNIHTFQCIHQINIQMMRTYSPPYDEYVSSGQTYSCLTPTFILAIHTDLCLTCAPVRRMHEYAAVTHRNYGGALRVIRTTLSYIQMIHSLPP